MRVNVSAKFFAAALVLVSSLTCAQSKAVINANAEGNKAYYLQDFESAFGKFELALKLATESENSQYRAIAMYGLARTSAQLCKISSAEKWFRESIALREKLPDDRYALLTQNIVEFSRFLLANKRVEDAVPYMSKAIPLLESLEIEKSDPVAYLNFLDSYIFSLQKLGRTDDVEKISVRASELRTKYPGQSAKFKPDPYPLNCPDMGR